jgi:hypothetical protein
MPPVVTGLLLVRCQDCRSATSARPYWRSVCSVTTVESSCRICIRGIAGSWDAAGSLKYKNSNRPICRLCVKSDVNACANQCNHGVKLHIYARTAQRLLPDHKMLTVLRWFPFISSYLCKFPIYLYQSNDFLIVKLLPYSQSRPDTVLRVTSLFLKSSISTTCIEHFNSP